MISKVLSQTMPAGVIPVTIRITLIVCTLLPINTTGAGNTERSFTASLIRVIDGDSLWVRDRSGKRHELRLSAIDAPERDQEGGDTATESLRKLLGDQPLRVTISQTDRYKRLIAHVRVGQQDIGEQMLSAGHAWYYRRFKRALTRLRRETYDRAEARAKRQRRGLWSQAEPVAPWLYRQQQRRQRQR